MSDNTILLITDEQIDWLAKFADDAMPIDEWVKRPILGKILEAGDGPIIRAVLNGVNNLASPHIPDGLKDNFQVALDDVIDGDKDYSEAIDQIDVIGGEILDMTQLSAKVKGAIKTALGIVEIVLGFLAEPTEPEEE